MNKHVLSTIAAAMVPLGAQGAITQASGTYSYIGNKNRNTVISTVNSYKSKQPDNTSLLTIKPLSLTQEPMPDTELFIAVQHHEQLNLATVEYVSSRQHELQITHNSPINELIIIDQAVPDKHLFYQDLKPGTEVKEIASGQDGLVQLNQILSQYQVLDALHLVSHADDGVIYLGNTLVTEQLLKKKVDTFSSLNHALKDGADLLIYGCNLAKTDKGVDFLDLINRQTHLDIAASDDLTGAKVRGGDWDLEIVKGNIEINPIFDNVTLKDFSDVLAYTGTIDFASIVNPGEWSSNSAVNASVSAGLYTLIGDGASVSTYANAGYSTGALHTGTNTETQLTLSFSGGEVFDATSIKVRTATPMTVRITPNSGTAVTQYLAADILTLVDLSSFGTGLTSIALSNNLGGAMGYTQVDDFAVANVQAANAVPVNTLPSSPTVNEDDTNVAIADDIAIADDDTNNQTVTLTMTGGTASITTGAATITTGVDGTDETSFVFNGTLTDVNTTLDSLTFTPTANLNGTNAGSIQIQTDDGNSGTDDDTLQFNIVAVNDAPTITSSGTTSLGAVNEETASTGVLVSTILAGGTVGYAEVDSAPSSGVAITAATGTGTWEFSTNNTTWTSFGAVAGNAALLLDSASYVRFTGGTEYAGTPALTFQAWDQTTGTASTFGSAQIGDATTNGTTTAYSSNSAGATITINAVNDIPSDIALTAASINQSVTSAGADIGALSSTDVDSGGFTYSLVANAASDAGTCGAGNDANNASFQINTATFETAGALSAGSYKVCLQTSDGAASYQEAFTINVADDVAPVISEVTAVTTPTGDTTPNVTFTTNETGTITLGGSCGTSSSKTIGSTGNNTITLTQPNDSSALASATFSDCTITLNDGINNSNTITLTSFTVDADTPLINSNTYSGTEDTPVDLVTAGMAGTQETAAVDALNYYTITGISGGTLAISAGASAAAVDTSTPTVNAVGAVSVSDKINPADIAKVTFTPTLNSMAAGSVTYTVTDFGGNGPDTSVTGTLTINLAAVNDDPTGVSEPVSIAFTEDTADDLDISAITLGDVDSASLDVVLTAGSGTMTASNGGSVTVTNSGTSAITLTGSPTDIDTYLNTASNIQYTGSLDDNGAPATTLTVTANDGDGSGVVTVATINLNITEINDEPTIGGTNDTATHAGGAVAVVVFSSADIAVDVTTKDTSDVITGVTLIVTNVSDTEVIKIDGSGDISLTADSGPIDLTNIAYTITYSGTTATITLTGLGGGTVTEAALNTALNAMTYQNQTAAPTEANRVFTITQIVDNGSTGGSHDNTWNGASVFSTITVMDGSKPTASNYTDSTTEDAPIAAFSATELPTTVDVATSDPIEYISINTANITGGVLSITDTTNGTANTPATDTTVLQTVTGDLTTGTVNIDITDIGSLVFTPTADLAGTGAASIVWTVTDDAGHTSATATYTLDITNTSDDPTGADKAIALTTAEIHTFAASGFGFSDVDTGDALNRVRIDVQAIDNGTLELSSVTVSDADWIALADITNLVYTPTAAGTDSFTFTVEDDSDNSTAATPSTVTFTVTPDNTAPVISSGISTSVTMSEDGEPTTFALTLSASDANADTLTWAINGGASNGIAFTTGTGNSKAITYTPSANFFGSDSFTVSVSDGSLSDTILVNVNVISVNDIPVITGTPTTTVAEESSYSFTPSTSDVDSTSFTYSITNKPSWATFSTTTGALTGTPTNDDVGSTSNIVISVSDDVDSVALPSFAIEVTSTNTAPIVGALSISLNEDEESKVDLSATDTDDDDTLTLSIVSEPANGTLTSSSSNTWTYQPDENFHGTDSFTYKANDTEDDSNIATVSITVTPVNDKPVAIDDVITLAYNSEGSYSLAVLGNDTDVDEDDLSIVNASVDLGSVTVEGGQLIYQAPVSAQSDVNFTYVISDGTETAQAKVALTIEGAPTGDLPVITLPADVTVNATGLFTKVDLGVATAVDSAGKPVPVSLKDGITLFEPGNNIAYWQAIDSNGLTSISMQKVVVIPLVSISKDEISSEGTSHKVGVYLNGASPTYPVVIAYTVSGSMDATDHDLVSGDVTIETGESTTIDFNVLSDSTTEALETLTITLDNGASYTLTVSEQNIAPEISYTVTQDDEQRSVIEVDAGDVVIQAQVSDGNPEDTHTYSWSSESGLGNGDNTTFTLSSAGLAVGIQKITLTVTDSAETPLSTSANIYLEVRVALPTLTSEDTDGDFIPDDQEGLGDDDNDGIPNYLDVPSACNVMPEQASETTGFLVEGNPGVCLRKGSTVVDNELGGLELKPIEVSPDEQAKNVGGLFDFIAYGLPKAGQTYELVLPQRLPIPANATYRKYTTEKGWFEFVIDANNNYASSAGDMGFCPPPADDSWTIGLTEGHWCVRLTIEDGGPNDDDGEANGSIVDPGGVAVWLSSNTFPQMNDETEQTSWNTEITIDVLANDVDADGDVLTLQSASVDFGVVEIINEQLVYTPPTDFFGVATINYGVSDNSGGTGFAQVSVDVIENKAPVATNDQANADDHSAITIDVLANDTDEDDDSLTVITASVDNGSVIINADNTLSYTSESGFNGIATINYTIDDGVGNQSSAEVTVTVTAYETITVTNKSSGGGSMGWLIGVLGLGLLVRRKKSNTITSSKGA